MNRRVDVVRRLDRVLASMEESILKASDRELLADRRGADRASQLVEQLIRKGLEEHALRRSAARSRPLKRHVVHRPSIPEDAEARVRLLRRLMRARSADLPASFRAAFAGREKPSLQKVDEMLRKAIRLGVLKKKKT